MLASHAGGCVIAAPFVGHFKAQSISRRTIFVVGLPALGGSTVLLCVGSSIDIFMLVRTLQGVSSAFTWTVGFTLAVETVRDDEIGKEMGISSLRNHRLHVALWANFTHIAIVTALNHVLPLLVKEVFS